MGDALGDERHATGAHAAAVAVGLYLDLTARYTYADAPPQGGLCVVGPPGPQHPATFFVAGTLNEMSHHGTQICTLRDLHAAQH